MLAGNGELQDKISSTQLKRKPVDYKKWVIWAAKPKNVIKIYSKGPE